MWFCRNRPNDTGILHRGIGLHQRDQLLNRFLGFAKNGLFGMGELEALVDQNSVDFFGNESDLSATRGEMATILAVFGTYNNSLWRWMFGLKVITVDDVRALWIRHEFPQVSIPLHVHMHICCRVLIRSTVRIRAGSTDESKKPHTSAGLASA